MVNAYHMALFYCFYEYWTKNQCCVNDFDRVLKMLEAKASDKKSVKQLLQAFESYVDKKEKEKKAGACMDARASLCVLVR